MSDPEPDMGAIVLAGGDSMRFGPGDKALSSLGNGNALIQQVVSRLDFMEQVVICTRDRERGKLYSELTGKRTVKDEGKGILGGILAGCLSLRTSSVFLVGADMPLIDERIIDFQRRFMGNFQATVPRHPNGYLEPLHSVIRREPAIGWLNGVCRDRVVRVRRLFDGLRTRYLPVSRIKRFDSSLGCFTNINDRETLVSVREKLASFRQARNSRSSSSESARAFTSSLERD